MPQRKKGSSEEWAEESEPLWAALCQTSDVLYVHTLIQTPETHTNAQVQCSSSQTKHKAIIHKGNTLGSSYVLKTLILPNGGISVQCNCHFSVFNFPQTFNRLISVNSVIYESYKQYFKCVSYYLTNCVCNWSQSLHCWRHSLECRLKQFSSHVIISACHPGWHGGITSAYFWL